MELGHLEHLAPPLEVVEAGFDFRAVDCASACAHSACPCPCPGSAHVESACLHYTPVTCAAVVMVTCVGNVLGVEKASVDYALGTWTVI